ALKAGQRYRRLSAGPVTGLTMAAADGRSRVVVELTQAVRYGVSRNGNTIRIAINVRATNPSAAAATGNATPPPANRVTNVDFRRNIGDTGQVEITLTGSSGPIDVSSSDGNIVA